MVHAVEQLRRQVFVALAHCCPDGFERRAGDDVGVIGLATAECYLPARGGSRLLFGTREELAVLLELLEDRGIDPIRVVGKQFQTAHIDLYVTTLRPNQGARLEQVGECPRQAVLDSLLTAGEHLVEILRRQPELLGHRTDQRTPVSSLLVRQSRQARHHERLKLGNRHAAPFSAAVFCASLLCTSGARPRRRPARRRSTTVLPTQPLLTTTSPYVCVTEWLRSPSRHSPRGSADLIDRRAQWVPRFVGVGWQDGLTLEVTT